MKTTERLYITQAERKEVNQLTAVCKTNCVETQT